MSDALVGKTIRRVMMNPLRTFLVFECADDSKVCFCTEGDCCSRSWIEHTDGVDYVKGRKVEGVSSADLHSFEAPDVDGPKAYEGPYLHPVKRGDNSFKVYSTTFALDNGSRFSIEFRNQSNGYYGGNLECVAESAVPWAEMGTLSEDI